MLPRYLLLVLALSVSLLAAPAQADWLGGEPRVDLYSMLIISASRIETAELLLDAAYDDSQITYKQYKQLKEDLMANHAAQ